MALHGHTTIELRDVHSGRRQLVEKDNIITNAVAEIFKPFGLYTAGSALLHDTNTIAPNFMTSFFGGLVLYDTALGANPDTMFAPATAHVTGCAGYNLPNDGTNPLRGSSNMMETVLDYTNGMVKYVYDFSTSQGNGTIASVCLANLHAGHFCSERAAGPQKVEWSGTIDTLNSGLSGPVMSKLSYVKGSAGNLYEIDEENDRTLHAQLIVNGEASLILRRYAALLHSVPLIWRKSGAPPLLSTIKVDLNNEVTNKSAASYSVMNYDAERRKIYVIAFANNPVQVNAVDVVCEIDPDSGEKKVYRITNQTGEKLSGWGVWYSPSSVAYVYNGVLYRQSYGTTDGHYHYYAIPLEDPGSVVQITNNGNDLVYLQYARAGRLYSFGRENGTVLNTADNTLYSIPVGSGSYPGSLATVAILGRKMLCLSNAADGYPDPDNSFINGGRLAIPSNYLATINDLAAPVVKTADKTMKITYTLRNGE